MRLSVSFGVTDEVWKETSAPNRDIDGSFNFINVTYRTCHVLTNRAALNSAIAERSLVQSLSQGQNVLQPGGGSKVTGQFL